MKYKEEIDDRCPHGGNFGHDLGDREECTDCKVNKQCYVLYRLTDKFKEPANDDPPPADKPPEQPVATTKVNNEQLRDEKILIRRLTDGNGLPPLDLILDRLMKRRIDIDLANVNLDDDEVRLHEEAKSLTKFYYDIKKYIAVFENTYRDTIWKKEKELPLWMLKDAQIAWIMEKTRLSDVLKALRKHSQKIPDRRRTTRLVAAKSIERRKKNHLPVCFITDKAFYDEILPELKMAQITLQHYIIGLREVGAIKVIDKKGFNSIPNNARLNCIGYHHDYEGGQKTNYLLTKELRKELRTFKLPSSAK